MQVEYVALIPSYKPDGRLITTAKELLAKGFKNIVIVNDGSDEEYNGILTPRANSAALLSCPTP